MRNKQRALEEEIENIAQGNTTSQSFFVKYFKILLSAKRV